MLTDQRFELNPFGIYATQARRLELRPYFLLLYQSAMIAKKNILKMIHIWRIKIAYQN